MKNLSAFFHQIILFYRPFETKLNQLLDGHGLHRAQWASLYYLEKYESMTLVELAKFQGVEKPTVTRTIAKLENLQLVEPVVTADKREKRMTLTTAGRALYAEVRQTIDAFENDLLEDVPIDKQQEIIDLLKQLREKL